MIGIVLAIAMQSPNGPALFEDRCAVCHAAGTDPRVPTAAALRDRTPQAIVDALTTGVMREQGADLTDAPRRALADFLTGAKPAEAAPVAGGEGARCSSTPSFDPSTGPRWTAWSGDLGNTRFQSAVQAGLTADQVPKLVLKWAFGFPNATSARALPTVAGGRLFVGSQSGLVYALDAKSGCTIWTFQAKAGVRSGITTGARPGNSKYDTNRSFDTVNGVPAKGASINGPGPVVVGGMLYINSGYGALGGRPGNVLLAFSLP